MFILWDFRKSNKAGQFGMFYTELPLNFELANRRLDYLKRR